MTAEALRRARLGAQGLGATARFADPRHAAAHCLGMQAQDLRAQGLALRSRVPALERTALDDDALVRTWSWRGTVHLHAREDLAWIEPLCLPVLRGRFEQMLRRRGALETAIGMADDIAALADERGPISRAELLAELARRGHASLGDYAVNVIMPWAACAGLVSGRADGRFEGRRASEPVDREAALAMLGRRYRVAFGPSDAGDLAAFSGLGVTVAREALALAGPPDEDEPPPPPATVKLLAGFDTVLLAYRSRDWFVARRHGSSLLPGSGIVKATVLVRGRVAGTWKVSGSGARRQLACTWFGAAAPQRALAEEAADVGRFLGFELVP